MCRMISITIASSEEELKDTSFSEEVKQEISVPKYSHLTVSLYNSFPNKFIVYPGHFNIPHPKYFLLLLPLFILIILTPVLYRISIHQSWGEIQNFSLSDCTVRFYEESLYFDYYDIYLHVSYLNGEKMETKPLELKTYSTKNNQENFVRNYYRTSFQTNDSFPCYFQGDFVIAKDIVEHRINTTWKNGLVTTLGFSVATIFLLFTSIFLTAIVFVQGRKTFMKWDTEKKLEVEVWGQVPKDMRIYIHSFLETYYVNDQQKKSPTSRILEYNTVSRNRFSMKLFFIGVLTLVSVVCFAVTFALNEYESKMVVCWAVCYTVTVVCCYLVWLFLGNKSRVYFSATIETTTDSGTEQIRITHGDYYTSLAYGYVITGTISTDTPEQQTEQ